MKKQRKIIISRTDSIGDVVLTLPLAGALKAYDAGCKIIFLGRDYTRDVVSLSKHVDEFASWDDTTAMNDKQKADFIKKLGADTIIHVFPRAEIARAAAKAKISLRIGSTGRLYHYRYCNKLIPLSRKNSSYHEAQLNFVLLKPITGLKAVPPISEIQDYYGFQTESNVNNKWTDLLEKNKFNLILHPKSKGSAREWPLRKYTELVNLLPEDKFKIFVTGTLEEGSLIEDFLNENKDKLTNLTGKFNLKEFISFVSASDGLVAASTGPLHLAAALGKLAVGIYPPIKPMHPGRWAPIGLNAHYAVIEKECNDCRKTLNCQCMTEVGAEKVTEIIKKYGRK